ncbi:rubrerythrin family protein, partial [Candidatus Woesearchaeota archaeon]|nr:rubrerythrin family protein [Candidatus Woesearchaeota archaeon]
GITYFVTVLFLVLPFWIFSNVFVCLGVTIAIALFAIFLFTFYTHVAMDIPFRKRFFEMAFLSLGIAAFSFFVGWAIRVWLCVSV